MPAPLVVIVWGAAIAMVVLAAGIDAVLRGAPSMISGR
jgi:hypothetical protein